MTRIFACAIAVAVATIPAVALGQGASGIAASRPDELAAAMRDAGYKVELGTADDGNPTIDTEFNGWSGTIYFSDCNSQTHDNCQSLMLRTGFDRRDPMPLEMINDIVSTRRYMAIHLDQDGDPWADWDIVTGEGIPKSVFFSALHQYALQIEELSNAVFAEERGGN